ncbi:hypothetical protein TWF696_009665 [Orbilia brochopaga]|uniref:Uncharacterized protein n=1 Tax=Orbilia brochopaga TaxID=3140254 RepID=A0AAV9UFK3_9PEZI
MDDTDRMIHHQTPRRRRHVAISNQRMGIMKRARERRRNAALEALRKNNIVIDEGALAFFNGRRSQKLGYKWVVHEWVENEAGFTKAAYDEGLRCYEKPPQTQTHVSARKYDRNSELIELGFLEPVACDPIPDDSGRRLRSQGRSRSDPAAKESTESTESSQHGNDTDAEPMDEETLSAPDVNIPASDGNISDSSGDEGERHDFPTFSPVPLFDPGLDDELRQTLEEPGLDDQLRQTSDEPPTFPTPENKTQLQKVSTQLEDKLESIVNRIKNTAQDDASRSLLQDIREAVGLASLLAILADEQSMEQENAARSRTQEEMSPAPSGYTLLDSIQQEEQFQIWSERRGKYGDNSQRQVEFLNILLRRPMGTPYIPEAREALMGSISPKSELASDSYMQIQEESPREAVYIEISSDED